MTAWVKSLPPELEGSLKTSSLQFAGSKYLIVFDP